MRRILFQETDFNSLPLPPSGFKYIGFDGPTFSQRGEDGQTIETGTSGATGPQGISGATGPQGPAGAGGGGSASVIDVTYSELSLIIGSSSLTPGSYYKITDFRTCYDQPDFDINGYGITSSNTYKISDVDPIIVFATSENTLSQVAYQPSYPKDQIKYDWSWSQTEITGGTAYGRITERIDEYNNRTDYDHRNIRFKRYKTRLLNGTLSGAITSMNDGLVIGTATNFTGDFGSGSVVFIESYDPKFYKITDIISETEMMVEGLSYYNFSDTIGFQYQGTYTEENFSALEYKQTNIAEDNLSYRELLTFDLDVNAKNNYIGNACDTWSWDDRPFMLPNNVFTNAFDNNVDIYDNKFGNNFVNNTFGDDVYENYVGPDARNNTCQDRFDRNFIVSNFYNNTFYNLEFESNLISEGFSNNIMINDDGDDFYNNQIGCNFYDNRFFSGSRLYENKIGNNFNNNKVFDDIYRNNIGDDFYSNQIYREMFDNTIRNYFNNNYIYNQFYDNNIDNQFENNTIGTSNTIGNSDFLKNKIGVDVKGNIFYGYVSNNIIGNEFTGNELGFDFNRNVFGSQCVQNVIGEDFEDNQIGNYFSFNNIENYFVNNKIGNYFNGNVISYNFAFNEIGHNFYNNNIDHDFGYGGGQAYGNKIGNYFEGNTIGDYFYNNKIADVFFNNTIGRYFQSNDIQTQNLSSTDFNTNYGNIIMISDTSGASPSTPGTDGTYNGLTASGGSGYNATFDVQVSGSIVTQVLIASSGNEYQESDTLIIEGSKFGGTDGSDIIITVTSVSSTPVVYTQTNSTIVKNQTGDIKLYYLSDFGIVFVNAIESFD